MSASHGASQLHVSLTRRSEHFSNLASLCLALRAYDVLDDARESGRLPQLAQLIDPVIQNGSNGKGADQDTGKKGRCDDQNGFRSSVHGLMCSS